MRRLWLPLLLIILASAECPRAAAADPTPALPPLRNAPPPKAGMWMDYVVTFPLDPMEYALRLSGGLITPQPIGDNSITLHFTNDNASGIPLEFPPPSAGVPNFDPQTMWMAVPLRLEVLSVDGPACTALMTFGGLKQEVTLPCPETPAPDDSAAHPSDGEEVVGDLPAEDGDLTEMFARESLLNESQKDAALTSEKSFHWFGEQGVDVVLERIADQDIGITRLRGDDLPFGIARVATKYVDLVLVAWGVGIAPEFPPRDVYIEPPPGKLHPKD